jgi:signal transduction histidine kinase
VTPRNSLEDRVARWFAGTLVVLYGLAAIGIWGSSRQNGRQFAMLALKTEAEAVASYVAASGRLDAPELAEMESEPFPIWLRITGTTRLLAETPGSPDPPKGAPESTEDVSYWRPAGGGAPLLVLRHAVGGEAAARLGSPGERITVHAIGDLAPVRELELRLGAGLGVLAILMIPFSTWVGRRIARRALTPISGLVDEIRTIGGADAERRLSVPAGAVAEVSVLAESFNDVLARLEANLEAMRRFTEDASHEIRNPLAVLRTGLEVVLRQERPAVEYRALLVENLEEIQRLQSILDGLLLLARTERGRRDLLQREPLDLARVAAETTARFAVVAAERRSPIEVVAPATLPFEGDPRLVRLAVFNLIDNALKHGPEGRPIRLELAAEPGGARCAVVTEGAPISTETRNRLFERYDRPNRNGETRGGVGGLGLSVVRWAAEAHGGEARYVAGEGTNRFELTLREAPGNSD